MDSELGSSNGMADDSRTLRPKSCQSRSLRELFIEAAQLPSRGQQQAWLESVCPTDEYLRTRVLELLSAAEQPEDNLLDHSADFIGRYRKELLGGAQAESADQQALGPDVDEDAFTARQLPFRIGPYELQQEVGRGGMSVVYRAVQSEPLERNVAIKILALPIWGPVEAARFYSEQRLLARLQHPNIAAIFDSGVTPDGETYFAMEYIDGLSITDFCRQFGLSVRQRLQIAIQLCEAVAYAHRKGIIHRDLKPSNILVAHKQKDFLVKVIDFGVAKAIADNSQQSITLTGQRQVIGTPLYMSPEQMRPRERSVDTLSDVYSIGCILYELLVGHAPYDSPFAEPLELHVLERLVSGDRPPLKPTLAVKAIQQAGAALAATNGTIDGFRAGRDRSNSVGDYADSSGPLDREIDWIILKSLEKDKSRRYKSADSLAEDLQRYLKNEPLLAGPPSFFYAFRKLVSRHRVEAAIGLLAIASLFGATVVSLRQMQAARVSARVADKRLEQVQYAQAVAEKERKTARESEIAAKESQRAAELAHRESLAAREKAAAERYNAEIRLASDAVISGELSLATRLVFNHLPEKPHCDRRGIEWWLLRHLLDRQPYWSVAADQPIVEMAVAPNEDLVAVSTDSRDVQIFSVNDGQLKTRIPMKFRQRGLAWNPATGHLAMGGVDGSITLGRLNLNDTMDDNRGSVWQWEPIAIIDAHRRYVSSLGFTADGKYLVSASGDQMLRVWSTDEVQMIAECDHHQRSIQQIAISADGQMVATAASDGQLCIWAIPELRLQASWMFAWRVVSVAFSPDCQRLVAGDIYGHLMMIDLASNETFSRRLLDGVETVQFCGDSENLVVGDRGGKIQHLSLVHADDGHNLVLKHDQQWLASDSRVKSLNVLSDGSLLSADRFGMLCRWKEPSGGNSILISNNLQHEGNFCFTSPWEVILPGPQPKCLDLRTGNSFPWMGLSMAGYEVSEVDIMAKAESCNRVALANARRLILYDLDTQNIVQDWPILEKPSFIAVSPDGRRVSITFRKSVAQVLCFEVGNPHRVADFSVRVPSCLRISNDGETLAVGHLDDLHLIRWGADTVSLKLQGHDSSLTDCLFLDNPARIVSASGDRRLKVWDAATGQLLLTVEAHSGKVNCLAVSKDGKRMISGGMDKTFRIWDLHSWQQLLAWPTAGNIEAVSFFAEDQGVIARFDDGQMLVLHANRSP